MPDEPYLLASDLDGTLIPPASVDGDGGVAELRTALAQKPGTVAYATGRHLGLALEGVAHHRLPLPDILVCDVGTSVYLREDGGYRLDPRYRDLMIAALGGADPTSLGPTLEAIGDLRLQEPEKQAEFKLSYYAPSGRAGEEVAARAAALLAESGATVNIVYSVDAPADTGLLDVLPAGVAKDAALRHVHQLSGVAKERVLYAGDTGNDRAALLSGYNAVLVGNATEPFKEQIRLEAEERGLGTKVHVAQASYARGVLEGCHIFGIL